MLRTVKCIIIIMGHHNKKITDWFNCISKKSTMANSNVIGKYAEWLLKIMSWQLLRFVPEWTEPIYSKIISLNLYAHKQQQPH